MQTLVCIQHNLTPEQHEELSGQELVFLKGANPALFAKMANSPSNRMAIIDLAIEFYNYVKEEGFERLLLPLGSPALQTAITMVFVVKTLNVPIADVKFIQSMFAHSNRESVDEKQPDGSIKKVAIFKHEKFIVL